MTGDRARHTGFLSEDDSTGLMLWRVTNAWQAAQRAALKPFWLTHVQFVLLASLAWLDGDEPPPPPTQQQLASYAHTDPMMTSQALRTLEGEGLIERVQHRSDGRARLLHATKDGIALANRAVVAVEAVDATFFAPLDTERDAFTSHLSVLASRG
ncbi:MAG TPA: MarR family transcriptional regulator [Galbitalea sp.]|jgi:DNA-binding MarR family transcriptional regulator